MLIIKFLQELRRALHVLARSQPNDERVATFRRSLLSELAETTHVGQRPSYCVAVQGVHDPLFYSLFAAIMTDLRKIVPVNGRLILVNSINYAVGSGWKQKIQRSLPFSWLISSQWSRANREVVGPVGYRSHSLRYPLGDLYDWFRAWNIWKSLQSSGDISDLIVDNLLVGDLVVDSYLRFRPSPEFKISDTFVRRIIWQALRDIRRARAFFRSARPKLYLSSYSTYVEHGIAVRVAIECGVPVRVYGNLTVFGKILTLKDFYHTPDSTNSRNNFSALPNQKEALTTSEKALAFRLKGGIDTATSYMRRSAYSESDELVPDVAGAVVVFLHDFYDSPHIYADLVFPDFWTWIVFTIETLNTAGIGFWIKPHPNQISASDTAFNDLLKLYPGLRVISPKITNAQLVHGGIRCGITVYGTVAHELAYMGVPSIGCARHPHHAFDFCRTAYSRDEYKELLLTSGVCEISKDEMRLQALEFFYMHNLHGGESELIFRAQLAKYFKLAADRDAGVTTLSACLAELRELPAWKKHVGQIADSLPRIA
jgi:hypothetical protein